MHKTGIHGYHSPIDRKNMSDPRDYFDTRPDILRTFTETALVVNSIELHRGERPNRRDHIYLVFSDYGDAHPTGFVEWQLNPTDNGIVNYDERIPLSCIPNRDTRGFIEEVLTDEKTIGIVAMDRRTALLLHDIPGLSREYKVNFIGMKKEHLRED
ncbi:MAG: hypothetical protein Q8Q31_02900 [Nanoarchaeota archaeon]|nr:hypothetical protein [Nanoarchaeota archaeon]